MTKDPSMFDKEGAKRSPSVGSGKLARRSFGVTIAMSISAIMELVRDVALVRLLGTGLLTDAFFLGIVIPVTFAGALQNLSQTVILPWFGASLQHGSKEIQERFYLLFLVAALPTLLIIMIGVFFAPQIAVLLDGPTIDLNLLTVIVRFALPVVGLAIEMAVLSAFLNATGHYTTVAARKILNIATFLLVFYLLREELSAASIGLAFLAGYLVEFGSLAINAFSKTRLSNAAGSFQHWDELLIVLRASLYPAIAFGFARLSLVIERVLAGYLTVGSVSAVTLARRSTLAIATIVGQGIKTVTLSEMSQLREGRDSKQGKYILTGSVRLTILLLVPIAALLVVFHDQIAIILFAGRGTNLQVLSQTSDLMMLFGIALPFYVIAPLLLNTFFAIGDTRSPSIQKIVAVVLNIVLLLILVWSLGTLGFGIAFLVTVLFSTIWAGISVTQQFGPFVDRVLVRFILKVSISALLLAIVCAITFRVLAAIVDIQGVMGTMGIVAVSAAVGALALIILLYILRVEEILRTWDWTRSKALVTLG